MASRDADNFEVDPDDGLTRAIVGEWALAKHARLKRYVGITSGVRQQCEVKWDRRSAFIDLYCGPGRARIRETSEVIDGSALVAAKEALTRQPFSEIHICDLDANRLQACTTRMNAAGFSNAVAHHGAAEHTASEVVGRLDPKAFHFAFIDPFNLSSLPFSVMDFNRNLEAASNSGLLERFAPDWQKAANRTLGVNGFRRKVFKHWLDLIRSLGFAEVSDFIPPVQNSGGADIYWLVLASRHKLADKLWKVAADVEPQNSFQF